MNDKVSSGINAFLTFLRDAEQHYRMAEADEQDANNATQDLLHALELDEHSYHEYARISKQLRDVRRHRRVAKDNIGCILPIREWIEENRQVIKALERVLGETRKAEKSMENRIYVPRTDVVQKR